MASSSSSKLLQVISYAINQNSMLPLISRMHLYDAMNNYIFSQEHRLTTLENKISQLQTKLESFENHYPKEHKYKS